MGVNFTPTSRDSTVARRVRVRSWLAMFTIEPHFQPIDPCYAQGFLLGRPATAAYALAGDVRGQLSNAGVAVAV